MPISSRPCTIDGCRSPTRTVCICCDRCYCFEHLNQHFHRINSKVPALSDKINALSNRLNQFSNFEPAYLVALERWRDEAHRVVEDYYETKRRTFVDDRRDKLKKEVERVRRVMDKLKKQTNATRNDVDLLTQDIKLIEQKFTELQSLRFSIQPLVIDENLIIREVLPLTSVCRTMKIPFDDFPAIATNEKHLLVHQPPNISLLDRHFSVVKELPWTHDEIWDMCWSSTLSKFFVLSSKQLFTIEPNAMTLAKCPISSDAEWSRVTCSESSLFLLTQGTGPAIFEYKLPPTNKGVKEKRAPETCNENEYIYDIRSNQKCLAMIIYNTENEKTRLDLRVASSLETLWTIDVGQGFRCCLLHGEQWLVADPLTRRLFHVSNTGKLIKTDKYSVQPWNIIQWGKFLIGIRTNEGINLH